MRDTMEIERDGKTVATIKKALVSPLRDRYSIEVEGGDDLEAKGNIVDHEYKIERDGDKVAEVSKRWFRVRDTYGIEVSEGQNDALIVALDSLYRSDGPRRVTATPNHRVRQREHRRVRRAGLLDTGRLMALLPGPGSRHLVAAQPMAAQGRLST